ncbi:uncharacterized protein LOC108632836 [Ceratina calcarata]|uniref:Protein amnionless n=1 Tax=Ceratina calcarata TaxID=156304 RepID=A0AAJ7JHS9_9HYME|nr:uncharacterized protein LOC108632836 [Ceratina calcarata]
MGSEHNVWILWLFLLMVKLSFGLEKHWLPNLEWETAENWVEKRIPELDSYVRFPLDMRHAVGIGSSQGLRLSGIDLPRSGYLVLSKNGRIEFSEPGSSRKTSEWLRSGHLFWADPQNWGGSSEAAPHFEQVPCREDDIVLPETSRTFNVLMPMKNTEVRSVRTSDEKRPFSQWQWSDMAARREFEGRFFSVHYTDYSCTSCPCQDDPDGYYLEEICAIERPKCGFTPCEFPLKVEGHCCRYCGGRVSLTSEALVPVVRAAVDEALERHAEKLAWHVRYTWKVGVEILIKEKGDYSEVDIIKATEDVKETLLSMKIDVVATETAGAAMRDHRLAVALIPLIGTPFVVLFLFFLGFLYFSYSYRHIASGCAEVFSSIRDGVRVEKMQSGKPFGFALFENISEGNVQIANVAGASEPKENEEKADEEDSSSGGRFENPLYRSKRKLREEGEILTLEAPLRLATLRDKVEAQVEEIDIDIDQ